jgi:hypothetical protein
MANVFGTINNILEEKYYGGGADLENPSEKRTEKLK